MKQLTDVINSTDVCLVQGARLDTRMIGQEEIGDLEARFEIAADDSRIGLERHSPLSAKDFKIRDPERTVLVLWSGGLDSTGVVGNLLAQGYDVLPLYLASRHGPYLMRELYCMTSLWHTIRDLNLPGYLYPTQFKDMLPIMDAYRLSADLIPNRNELFVQYATFVMSQHGISKMGTGEYTGSDHWVVGWHVPPEDCEPESFFTWMKNHLPLSLRHKAQLVTLDDFGPAHVKSRRLNIGVKAIGVKAMTQTTCCLSDTLSECGMCYCCVERAAAFHMLGEEDNTKYVVDPKTSWLWPFYLEQMGSFPV